MAEHAALELDTLTIHIPFRLQRRGGRKLIMTPEGVAAPARKPSGRNPTDGTRAGRPARGHTERPVLDPFRSFLQHAWCS